MKLTRDEFKCIYDQGFEATFAFVEQLLRSTLEKMESLRRVSSNSKSRNTKTAITAVSRLPPTV